MTRRSFRRGFTLIEVLVAFLLLAFVLTASITIFTWQKQRMLHQTLWRRAIEAVEEEVEAHRAIPVSMIVPGENLTFVTQPTPDLGPISMRWLPDPVARRDIRQTTGDPRLLTVVLTLNWGEPGKRLSYQEVFLLAK